ncbi:MAG: hypothetical protein WAM14_24390 [Candidatus Nitrosopolaris sp.]
MKAGHEIPKALRAAADNSTTIITADKITTTITPGLGIFPAFLYEQFMTLSCLT